MIIVSTGNISKVKEIKDILSEFNYEIKMKNEIGIYEDIMETGENLYENSYIKAKFLYDKCKEDVIADDSGLFVKALNWEPGVYSARFAGDNSTEAMNNELLLNKMKPFSDRYAEFRCVITLIEKTGKINQFEGICKGNLLTSEVGNLGFGYDPLFVPEGYDKTFAQLSADIKNKISHRAIALSKLLNYYKEKEKENGNLCSE